MKKTLIVAFCLLIAVAVSIALASCAPTGSNYTGTYYDYEDGVKNANDWIKLEKDKWSDNEGMSGRVEYVDGKVVCYLSMFGEEDVLLWGTVKKGVFTYTIGERNAAGDYVYYNVYTDNSTASVKDSTGQANADNNKNTGKTNGNDYPSINTGGESTYTGDEENKTPAIIQYKVIFDANGGEFNDRSKTFSLTTDENTTIEEPASPTMEEYSFNGWTKTKDGSNKWDFSSDKVTSDTTLYASWTKVLVEYEIKYVLGYAGAADVTMPTENGYATYSPKRSGYEFVGWYTDKELTKPWNMATKVTTNDVVLYAEWVSGELEEGQLPSPQISIDGNVFAWNNIQGAQGYVLTVTMGGEEQTKETLSSNTRRWVFPDRLLPTQAGTYTYTIAVYAKGDGEHTMNSSKTSRQWTYKLRVLDPITNLKYDRTTATFTWDAVQGVEVYSIYINKKSITQTQETSFDISNLDVGEYTFTVYAERQNWMTSDATLRIGKDKLKSPEVKIDFNSENQTYTASWAKVNCATTYKIKYGNREFQTQETFFTMDYSSTYWNKGETFTFTVQAYDDNTEYLISPVGETYTFTKLYRVSIEQNVAEAGNVSLVGRATEVTLSFDTNGVKTKEAIESQIITETQGMVFPKIPEPKSIYDNVIFTGWYTTPDCTTLFDFSKGIGNDTKVYAGWAEMYSGKINVTTSAQSEYSSVAVTNNNQTQCFVPLVSGTCTLRYYRNNYDTTAVLHDATDEVDITTISLNSSSVKTYQFSAIAGHVYHLNFAKSMYGTNAKISICTDAVEDGGKLYKGCTVIYAKYNAKITLNAATIDERYIFDGFYKNTSKLSGDNEYSASVPKGNVTYTAKWISYTVTTTSNLPIAGDYTALTNSITKIGDEVTLQATTNNGYTWLGWYDGDTKVSEGTSLTYQFIMPAENKSYVAKWMACPITLTMNYQDAGSVSGISTTAIGAETTITAMTQNGYTWLGWYDGDTKVSDDDNMFYSFIMTEESKVYTAKWTYYTISTFTNNQSAGSYTKKTDEKISVGESVQLSASTNNGYTWLGWYDEDTKVSKGDSLHYTFRMTATSKTYTAKWTYYTVSTNRNIAGGTYTQKSNEKVSAGASVTLTATTNDGYTWLGWYDGDNQVCAETTYTFTMPTENKTYTAKWTYYTLSANQNTEDAGSITGWNEDGGVTFDLNGASGTAPEPQRTGTLIYPEVPMRSGYVFAGWYDNAACTGSPFDFTATVTQPITLYAKWISYTGAGVLPLNGTIPNISVPSFSNTYSYKYYAFVPLVSGSISIYSTGNGDSYGYLYSATKAQLMGSYSGGDRYNFKLTYNVTAGTLYYVAPCGYSSITLSLVMEGAQYPAAGGQILSVTNEPRKTTVGKRVTLAATTNPGYTWLGWFDGDTKVSEGASLNYTFTMPAENKTYTAKWIACPISLGQNIAEAGMVSGVSGATAVGAEASITATTNGGYTWLGWFDGDTKVSEGTSLNYTFTMPAENKTYTAKWIVCPISLEQNIAEAGTVSGVSGATAVGAEATITATTNGGYTWLGWFDGDIKVSEGTNHSYTFTMPAENKTYTAKWTYFTVSTDTNLQEAGTFTTKSEEKVTVGDATTITATTNAGYTWLGWYDGDTKVSEGANLYYTFTMPAENKTYTAKWCKVTLASNNSTAGTISTLNDKYIVGAEATITATTNDGYTWLGWFDGDTKVSEGTSLNYTFTMPAENKTYTAKWIKVTIGSNNASAGTISVLNGKYAEGDIVTISATTTYLGYNWLGWYDGETKVSEDENTTFTFSMPAENKTYTAKWEVKLEMQNYYFTSNTSTCNITGIYDKSVTSLFVPNYVTQIALGAFSGCSSLESITLPFVGGSKNATSASSSTLFGYIFGTSSYTGGTSTKQYYGGSAYSTYYIPSSLRSVTVTGGNILYGAFYNCSMLRSVTIPADVTSIGQYAFACCGLTSITIPASVTSIPSYAFYNCSGLTSVTIPAGVTAIPSYAFDGCRGLTSIYYTGDIAGWCAISGLSYLMQYGSSGKSLYIDGTLVENLVIPAGVTAIPSYAFYNCSRLTSVTIPADVTSIGQYAFACCGLTSITIPASVTSIPSYAFYNCSGLTSVTIPAGVTSIGERAFYGCSGLTSVTFAEGSQLTSIGNYAFSGCRGLTSVTIPDSVPSITAGLFSGCSSLESITIPFVGGSKNVTSASSSSLFGYIFGTSSYTGGTSTVQYYGSSSYSTYYIPSTLRSVTVTGGNILYGAFYNCSGLTSVTIPADVTSIGQYAFACCGLTSITIPASVTSIPSYAFYNCSGLTSVTIPAGVTSIGNYAFSGCSGLTSIYYTGDIAGWCAISGLSYLMQYGSSGKSLYIDGTLVENLVIPAGVTAIPSYAFYNCSRLTSVTIPASVTSIGNSAFGGCSGLTSVTIPADVTSIGQYAFSGCYGLTSVTFAEGSQLSSIDWRAFYNCSRLTSITIPNSVTSIGDGTFSGCSSLMSITIPFVGAVAGKKASATYQYPFGYIFGTSSYTGGTATTQYYYGSSTSSTTGTTYYIPSTLCSVTVTGGNILYGAFSGCNGLTSVTIPDGVTSIGGSAFSGCSSLQSITIPFVGGSKNATSASSSTLFGYIFGTSSYTGGTSTKQWYDSSYSTYYIPSSLRSVTVTGGNILYGAFDNCSGLTSVTIGGSVTSIGQYAFSDCYGLTSVTIPDSVTSNGGSAFSGCSSLESITIPFVGAEAGKTASDTYQYPFGRIFGTNSYTGGTATMQYYYGSSTSTTTNNTYYIPSSLRSVTVTGGNILYGAFYNCSGLTSVRLPADVTSICDRAFYNCSGLTSVTIPAGVTAIPSYAFDGCRGLTSVTFAEGSQLTSIGDYAFRYCSKLTSVTIPNRVTSIGNGAFSGCSGLTSVTIPADVTSIGQYAFSSCSKLTSTNFQGTKAQWNAISKGSNWNSNTGNYTIYCTDGNISKS